MSLPDSFLRDYQHDGVNKIRASMRAGKKRPLFVLPTGGGKTRTFCYIAAATASKNIALSPEKRRSVIILVHRVELLKQTSAALHLAGVDHGLIHPDFTPNLDALVQVASVQTLVRRLDKIRIPPSLIVVDEGHHATAGTWQRIFDYFPNSVVLGVTATPCRSDGTGLDAVYDDLIEGATVQYLINEGYLVKPRIICPPSGLDMTGVRKSRGDYDSGESARRVDKPSITGSAVSHYLKLCPDTPAVVFCVSVEHAEHVAEEFRASGVTAYSIDGSMDKDTRDRILKGLAKGVIKVITSCDLISEGFDVPAIGCAILLRPTQSLGLFLQQVGRALRPCEGKSEAIILDHVGNVGYYKDGQFVVNHGFPEDERVWTLEGDRKIKNKSDDEETVRIKQCDNCYAIHPPAPTCPDCGYVYPVQSKAAPEQVSGELVEVSEAEKVRVQEERRREIGRAQSLEDLEKIAKDRNYKPGWAKHIWNARQKKNNVPV